MTTRVMAQKMMKQMHASDETDEETYIRHLAVFVRKGMIRHSNSFCANKFVKYTAFLSNLFCVSSAGLSGQVKMMQK